MAGKNVSEIKEAIKELRSELEKAKEKEEKRRIRAKLIQYGRALSRLEKLELELIELEMAGYLTGVKKLLRMVSKYNKSKLMKVKIIENSIRVEKQNIKVDLEVILLDKYKYTLTATISSPL